MREGLKTIFASLAVDYDSLMTVGGDFQVPDLLHYG
jgi:hypothetical protein